MHVSLGRSTSGPNTGVGVCVIWEPGRAEVIYASLLALDFWLNARYRHLNGCYGMVHHCIMCAMIVDPLRRNARQIWSACKQKHWCTDEFYRYAQQIKAVCVYSMRYAAWASAFRFALAFKHGTRRTPEYTRLTSFCVAEEIRFFHVGLASRSFCITMCLCCVCQPH